MSSQIFNQLRITPRNADFLDRRSGSRGEIFYDQTNQTLRIYDGRTTSGTQLAKSDLTNVSNNDFLTKAQSAGIAAGGGSFELTIAADDSTSRTITSGNTLQFLGSQGISTSSSEDGTISIENTQLAFRTIIVPGQASISSTTVNDSITLVAGNNITINTDADNKTISISSGGGGGSGGSFSFGVAGDDSVIRNVSDGETIKFIGSGNITTSTSEEGDVTIALSNNNFSSLTDAFTASATIDRIYLPAMTMLTVTNVGASAYRFDQYGATNNPLIYAISGTTIAFNLNVTGHPFLIQTAVGVNYSTGLVHVSTSGVVSTGANALGQTSGTLYWKIPESISGSYRYQCSVHAPMVGNITIKAIGAI